MISLDIVSLYGSTDIIPILFTVLLIILGAGIAIAFFLYKERTKVLSSANDIRREEISLLKANVPIRSKVDKSEIVKTSNNHRKPQLPLGKPSGPLARRTSELNLPELDLLGLSIPKALKSKPASLFEAADVLEEKPNKDSKSKQVRNSRKGS